MKKRVRKNPKPYRQERWAQRNGLARWAHIALRNGLRRGLLAKQPCSVCGVAEAEAHHADYAKPLDVVWLCPKHHKAHHRALRGAA
jgi:hypothetical protein